MHRTMTALGIAAALWIAAGLQGRELGRAAGQVRTPDVVYVGHPLRRGFPDAQDGRITDKDVVYDLGCGDGRMVVLAAKKYGCRGRGSISTRSGSARLSAT